MTFQSPIFRSGVFGGRPGLPIVTYIGTASATNDSTSYSFPSQSIGDEAADRLVIVAVNAHGTANNDCTIASVTILGSAATLHVAPSGTGARASGIASRLVPTGTSGTIAVTTTGTAGAIRIFILTMTGYMSAIPDVTPVGSKDNASGSTISVAMDVSRAALYVGGNANGTAPSWSSATLLVASTLEAGYSVALGVKYGPVAGHTEILTMGNAAYRGIAGVSWT